MAPVVGDEPLGGLEAPVGQRPGQLVDDVAVAVGGDDVGGRRHQRPRRRRDVGGRGGALHLQQSGQGDGTVVAGPADAERQAMLGVPRHHRAMRRVAPLLAQRRDGQDAEHAVAHGVVGLAHRHPAAAPEHPAAIGGERVGVDVHDVGPGGGEPPGAALVASAHDHRHAGHAGARRLHHARDTEVHDMERAGGPEPEMRIVGEQRGAAGAAARPHGEHVARPLVGITGGGGQHARERGARLGQQSRGHVRPGVRAGRDRTVRGQRPARAAGGTTVEPPRHAVRDAGHGHVALVAVPALEPRRTVVAELARLVQLGQVQVEQDALGEQHQIGVLGLPGRGEPAEPAELGRPRGRAAAAAFDPGVDAGGVAFERGADRGIPALALPDAPGALTDLEQLGAAVGGETPVAEPLPQLAARRAAGVFQLPQPVAGGGVAPGEVEVGQVGGADVGDAPAVHDHARRGGEPGDGRDVGGSRRSARRARPDQGGEECQGQRRGGSGHPAECDIRRAGRPGAWRRAGPQRVILSHSPASMA